MKPSLFHLVVVTSLVVLVLPILAQEAEETPAPQKSTTDPEEEPLELGTSERATVRLVLVDVVVIDRGGRTVADLTAGDFQVLDRGKPISVDTLDVDCRGGATDEPETVRTAARREAQGATDGGRRIVLAFDYLHLGMPQREDVLDQAMQLIKHGGSGDDEIMLAALNGGLRVEQAFTSDRDTVLRSLKRMQQDITLWNGNYSHLSEFGFVEGLTVLFDVLGTLPGHKAVVLYSGMQDVPLDLQFAQLAAVASTARCSVYPVDAKGLFTALDIGPG